MAANLGYGQWYIKENGGRGESVGIASTCSRWFIAEDVLRVHAETICRLFNEQAADTKEQNFNNHQHAQPAISGLCASCCRGCEFNGSRKGRTSCSDYVGFAQKQQASAQ